MADHLSTSEESDEDCSQIFGAGDECGYKSPELFDSPSSDVLASDSEMEDFLIRKRPRYETAPVSRVTSTTLKPNYPSQDRVPLRPLLAKGASTYRHAASSGRCKSPTFHSRGPKRSGESCSVDACFKQSEAAEMKRLLRAVVTRLDKIEANLETSTSSFSSADSVSGEKKAVPRVVRVSFFHFTHAHSASFFSQITKARIDIVHVQVLLIKFMLALGCFSCAYLD